MRFGTLQPDISRVEKYWLEGDWPNLMSLRMAEVLTQETVGHGGSFRHLPLVMSSSPITKVCFVKMHQAIDEGLSTFKVSESPKGAFQFWGE